MTHKIYFETKSNVKSYVQLRIIEDMLEMKFVHNDFILLQAKVPNVGNEIIDIKGEDVSDITKVFVDEFTDLLGKSIQKIKFKNS